MVLAAASKKAVAIVQPRHNNKTVHQNNWGTIYNDWVHVDNS